MTTFPKVVIDAGSISGEAPTTGIATYTRNLLKAFAEMSELHVGALTTKDTPLPSGIERLPTYPIFRRGHPGYWEHEVRRALDSRIRTAELFHNPHPHAPVVHPHRWVQTLHDVIPLVFHDPLMTSVRRRFRRFGRRYATADAIVSVSRHAADEGIRILGIDPRRIHVIHHGVDPQFVPNDSPAKADPPYISVVGEFSPRKGLAEAFGVISQLAEWGYPHRLAIAGRIPSELSAALTSLIAKAPRPDRIDICGFVPDLVSFYQGAAVHLVPSRYEGFGLPVLEAMACGTPVVAFDNSSLPEVVGDGGLLVPDGDVKAAATAIKSLIDDDSGRTDLRESGLQWAKQFTWAKAALAHAEVYRDVASR